MPLGFSSGVIAPVCGTDVLAGEGGANHQYGGAVAVDLPDVRTDAPCPPGSIFPRQRCFGIAAECRNTEALRIAATARTDTTLTSELGLKRRDHRTSGRKKVAIGGLIPKVFHVVHGHSKD